MGSAPLAPAGVASWHAVVTTADGDSVLEPGETAFIDLFVEMTPNVGEPDPDAEGSIVSYFQAAFFDVAATSEWTAGDVVSWKVNDWFVFLRGDSSYLAGDGSIRDILAYQVEDSGGSAYTLDPARLISIEWSPAGDYSPREVGALIDTREWADPDGTGVIPEDTGSVAYEPFGLKLGHWPLPDTLFSFRVVPAPSVVALLPLGAGFIARRRRR